MPDKAKSSSPRLCACNASCILDARRLALLSCEGGEEDADADAIDLDLLVEKTELVNKVCV